MSGSLPNQTPLNYLGTRATRPPQQHFHSRAPLSTDNSYSIFSIGDEWLNSSTTPGTWYKLVSNAAGIATWLPITQLSVTPISTINTIPPNALGDFTVAAGAGITITPGLNQITISTAGGLAASSFNVDAFTPPGTDPVVPDGTGQITISGAQATAGTVPTSIQTNSLASNSFQIEVQRASTQVLSIAAANGVSHFDAADFSVDVNGFVSLLGSSPIVWNLISINTIGLSNNGYIAVSPGGALTVSLPALSAVGDIIHLVLDGATSWQLTQAAGQQVRYGNVTTTLGAGGSITSNDQGDAICLVCRVANTLWTCINSMGNLIVV
jgi:hypothetical protein